MNEAGSQALIVVATFLAGCLIVPLILGICVAIIEDIKERWQSYKNNRREL